MINKDKLTPYDVQILNLVALAPNVWSLSKSGMFHQDFGGFLRSLYGFGLQQNSSKELTPHYRQLSWRGQILLRREWNRMLKQAVEGPPQRQDLSATGMLAAQQQQSMLAVSAGSPFGRVFGAQQANVSLGKATGLAQNKSGL